MNSNLYNLYIATLMCFFSPSFLQLLPKPPGVTSEAWQEVPGFLTVAWSLGGLGGQAHGPWEAPWAKPLLGEATILDNFLFLKQIRLSAPRDVRGALRDVSRCCRFASCYIAVCECLRDESDLQQLVLEVAEDAAKSGAAA